MNSLSSLNLLELTPQTKSEVREALRQLQVQQPAHYKYRYYRGQICFLVIMLIWVMAVSLYDVYWSFKTQEVLVDYEANPIGSWLINADGGDVALFMTAKTFGTLIVLISVPLIYLYKRWWGLTVASGLCIGQTTLFAYLNWGHLLS